jgi:Rrf2 family protein
MPVFSRMGPRDSPVGQNEPMHISARVDYGMRALCELGAQHRADPRALMTGEEIAQAQALPWKFLEGILRTLRQAGILASQRGADGGFRLDRDPNEITVADVVRALDGPLAAVRGERPEDVIYAGSSEHLGEVWIAMRAAMREVLEHTTIDDILNGAHSTRVTEFLESPGAWQRR